MIDALLRRLVDAGTLAPVDAHFARAVTRLSSDREPEVALAAALASRAVQHGHVCADLAVLAGAPLRDADDRPVRDVTLPPLGRWLAALASSRAAGTEGAPLVLAGTRLYLRRYHDYERRLAERLRARAGSEHDVDFALLRDGVDRLFGPRRRGRDADVDGQRVSVAIAARRGLCVISGGPGTGKTTTVVKVLALLQEQTIARGRPPLGVVMLAPTGKAAQRLAEAVQHGAGTLDVAPAVRAAIPRTATTIHRALGYQPRTPTRFRHDAESPLAADVVLVDEASMVDLAVMSKLSDAVAHEARLILLGDKDQLASVEAGAIFGDVFNEDADHRHSLRFAREIERATGERVPAGAAEPTLADSMVQLGRSWRYGPESGIGRLARAVNAGDADAALAVLRDRTRMPGGDVSLEPIDPRRPLGGALGALVREGFRAYVDARGPDERLEHLRGFRLLCAHRRGPLGAEILNAEIERALFGAPADGPTYDGRPILVTRNDPQLDLYNGDVGVVGRGRGGALTAFFVGADGRLRSLAASRLPPHETMFAMTVHKSQGSELEAVALVLPTEPSPVVTRELLYTGLSRARGRVDLFATPELVRGAIERRTHRASGLRFLLWDRV
jgi:exodeoxyribonuclease V alpha subunit